MSEKDYKKAVIDGLLKKYNARCAKNIATNRRIILKPAEVYKSYIKNNADILEKQRLNEAVSELRDMGFVTADYLRFSDDIEKIYLSEEKIEAVHEYLRAEYGIVSRDAAADQVREIAERYTGAGTGEGTGAETDVETGAGTGAETGAGIGAGTGEVGIVKIYCEEIRAQMEDARCQLIPERIEANLKMLAFLEKNKEDLYVREASMLVYGDSKWFENNNYEEICTFLRAALGKPKEEYERNDAILGFFRVAAAEQEIFIKGAWKIEWERHSLDVSKFQGGVAVMSGDVQEIKCIRVNAADVMTVENKTSYQRMRGSSSAMMYLGGFANRHQIVFLKKVFRDNPDVGYRHFGDIDIGGFLIHKHLCRETSVNFGLYCMGTEQLEDERFRSCLKELTDNDKSRLDTLMRDGAYSGILSYMKEHNVKLEQEIVSYYQ